MADILDPIESILLSARLGESHFREFKSAIEGPPANKLPRSLKSISKDIAETLVAFANTDGGELLVGVEDNGDLTGVPHSNDKIDSLRTSFNNHLHKQTPLVPDKIEVVEVDGLIVLRFVISKSTQLLHQTSDSRCLERKDRETVPASLQSLQRSRQEKQSLEYDRKIVDGLTLDDLNLELLNEVSNNVAQGISAEKLLQYLGLAEYGIGRLQIRRAVALLFAKDPSKWHPRLQVRILSIKGTELRTGSDYNVKSDVDISGNILELLNNSWESLRGFLSETRLSSDALFETQIIYPELACREALVNAIAHRDYSVEGQGIEILIFTDRLEIRSPGELLSNISLTDITSGSGAHQSRNSLVAKTLREVGYMRELGEGIRRMIRLMQQNDFSPPRFVSAHGSFAAILSQKSVYSKEEELWLTHFAHLPLTREQRVVVRFGIEGRIISPQTIFDEVGIVDTDAYRQLLDSMYKLGILERCVTHAEKVKISRRKKILSKQVPQFRVLKPSDGDKSAPPPLDAGDIPHYSKVFVGNLSWSATVSDVSKAFEQFGAVENVTIPKWYPSNKSRGFCFVEFERDSGAQAALESRDPIFVLGRRVFVNPTKGKG